MEVTCPWGEDERHCVALARRGVLLIADDGTPVDDDEGTLCVFDNGAWSPVCTQAFATQTMHTLCRYMGWPRGLYNQLVAKDQTKELEVVRDVKKGRSFQEGEQCSHVSLACDPSACGRRPLYIGIDQVPNDAVGAWPWAANLFVEDELVCGATLVHAKFIMTEMECATKVMEKATGKYVAFLIGQERRTRVGISPWAQVHWKPVELAIGLDLTVPSAIGHHLIYFSYQLQVRRVVSLKKLPNSEVVLGQVCLLMETQFQVSFISLNLL